MEITIDQVKKDLEKSKTPTIWYSSRTRWWTHSPEDLEQASKQGKIASEARIDEILADPTVPDQRKAMIQAGRAQMAQSDYEMPMDPHGAPLFMFTDPADVKKWISAAEEKPDHFGAHQLDAFMMAHHRNAAGQKFMTWQEINNYIDGIGAGS